MTMKDLQKKSDAELRTFVGEQREELRKLRFSASGGGTKSAHVVRNARKDIARALTELNARTRTAATEQV